MPASLQASNPATSCCSPIRAASRSGSVLREPMPGPGNLTSTRWHGSRSQKTAQRIRRSCAAASEYIGASRMYVEPLSPGLAKALSVCIPVRANLGL